MVVIFMENENPNMNISKIIYSGINKYKAIAMQYMELKEQLTDFSLNRNKYLY